MQMSRREFLLCSAAVSAGFLGLRALIQSPVRASTLGHHPRYGPLQPDPDNVLDLPEGFSYRVISRVGERMDDGFYVPFLPDGMGAFASPDGKTILIRNHELVNSPALSGPFGWTNELLSREDSSRVYDAGHGRRCCLGGTTTLVYDTNQQRLERQFLSLAGTLRNCAGGVTPWGAWISCEETVETAGEVFRQDHGYPFEVPARVEMALTRPVPLRAMGRFNHEAVAVDPRTVIVYQTEDRDDGLIYRFIPDRPAQLSAGGRLQALTVIDQPGFDTRNWPNDQAQQPSAPRVPQGSELRVTWMDLEDIESPMDDLRYRGFDQGAARFARGEGMWYGRGCVYFACTTGGPDRRGQIWRYEPEIPTPSSTLDRSDGRLELFIEARSTTLVENADNLTVAPWGDLIVCEDVEGGRDSIVGVTPEGRIYPIAENVLDASEFAGATFSPDGTTLFVNLQKTGITVAIVGPWQPR